MREPARGAVRLDGAQLPLEVRLGVEPRPQGIGPAVACSVELAVELGVPPAAGDDSDDERRASEAGGRDAEVRGPIVRAVRVVPDHDRGAHDTDHLWCARRAPHPMGVIFGYIARSGFSQRSIAHTGRMPTDS